MSINRGNRRIYLSMHAAGQIVLTDEAAELATAFESLQHARRKQQPTARSSDPVTSLAEELIAGLRAGEPLPESMGQLAYEATHAAAMIESERQLFEVISSNVEMHLDDALTASIPGALQNLDRQLQELLTDVRTAVAEVGTERSQDRLMAAPEPVRQAWIRLGELTDGYAKLRQLQRQLTTADAVIGDFDRVIRFAGEIKNLPDVWPTFGYEIRYESGEPTPWPENDPRERLIWLATHDDVILWVPTARELQEHWELISKIPLPKRTAPVSSITTTSRLAAGPPDPLDSPLARAPKESDLARARYVASLNREGDAA